MVASINLASPQKEIVRPPMVGLLAIWLRSVTMVASVNLATAIKDGCAKIGPNTDYTWESIGDTDHTWKSIGDKDRQSVNLATTKKNGWATSYGCTPGNMVASVNLATPKKEVAYGCAPGNMVAIVNYGCVF
jgi:hypothetical protein